MIPTNTKLTTFMAWLSHQPGEHEVWQDNPFTWTVHQSDETKSPDVVVLGTVTQIAREIQFRLDALPGQITTLVADAARLCQAQQSGTVVDSERTGLLERIEQLDRDAGAGVVTGRFLRFQVPGGIALYIIQHVLLEQTVRCVYVPLGNDLTAEAIDDDGQCLYSIAQRNIKRRLEQGIPLTQR